MSLTPGEANTHPRNDLYLNNHDNNMTPNISKKSINERLLVSNKSTNRPISNMKKKKHGSQNSQYFTNNYCNNPATNSKSFAEITAIFNFPNIKHTLHYRRH